MPPADIEQDAQFGTCASITGQYAAVSTPRNDEKGIDSGAIYIFYLNMESGYNWDFNRKYLATDGATDDQLGSGTFDISLHALSFSTNGLTAGTQNDDGMMGAAYFFDYPN